MSYKKRNFRFRRGQKWPILIIAHFGKVRKIEENEAKGGKGREVKGGKRRGGRGGRGGRRGKRKGEKKKEGEGEIQVSICKKKQVPTLRFSDRQIYQTTGS